MFLSIVKAAVRGLSKYPFFSILNITGLSIAMVCCTWIALFVVHETSYDRHYVNAGQIYRVVQRQLNDVGELVPDATTPPALGLVIQSQIPEIQEITRLFVDPGLGGRFLIHVGDRSFLETAVARADSSIFDVFSFSFIRGDAKSAFRSPTAVVLTASAAKKYFGNQDPIGKQISIDEFAPGFVSAVIGDLPDNMHFNCKVLAPLGQFMDARGQASWNWNSFYTYVKLRNGTDVASVNRKIRAIVQQNRPENKAYFFTQAVTDIHLHSHYKMEIAQNGDIAYVRIFVIVGLLSLIIACVNYINLATARASARAKEIAVRKLSGASRRLLMGQFIIESIFTTILAFACALLIAQLALPLINELSSSRLVLFSNSNLPFFYSGFLCAVIVGLLSGIYPAFYLSGLNGMQVLKGVQESGLKGGVIRKALVVLQFTVSIALVIGASVIIRQVDFMRNARLGLNKGNILVVKDGYYLTPDETAMLKDQWMKIPGVEKVAFADGTIGGQVWTPQIRYRDAHDKQSVTSLSVDPDFLSVYSIPLKEGRNFSPDFPADSLGSIILNETAVKELAIPSPVIGKQIAWRENPRTGEISYVSIIGVTQDFHFNSFRDEIKPFAFIMNPRRKWNINVKISGHNTERTLSAMKAIWDSRIKSRPFQFNFFDQSFAALYSNEVRFRQIFGGITAVAISIACLGLFGLSAFATARRSKEIGIRKVFGASAAGIVLMLSTDFAKLVVIASAIACPFGISASHVWLQNFAYKINIGWAVCVGAGALALFIAIFTISVQAFRAASANPVKVLRAE